MSTKKNIFILFFIILAGISSAQTSELKLLADTTVICVGDSFLVKFSEDQVSKTATYDWQTPKAIIIHAKQLYLKHPGIHIVKIADGKRILVDTTYVKLNKRPTARINDTIICDASIMITANNKNYTYEWSNGEATNHITIERPGIFWVKINNKGCIYSNTFKVTAAEFAVPNFGKELLMCENDPPKILSVKAPSDVKLYWNTGANTPTISITKEGIYWVKSISKSCGTKTDSVTVKYKNCDCDIYIPNSFTPNDDDRNDVFAPAFQCEYNYFLLTVFDRWGNTVYTSTNINGKWDGKFKGNPCPDDVYVYRLEAIQKLTDKKIIRNGHISLFR